ncbi:DUF2510 domain-containing protein [Rhodococcus erythropolis]|uniref:DUF2510 domain-containing protein n=1 Tax=Rhodococcus erythropolis TaxID=1833 RepID=UPI0040434218
MDAPRPAGNHSPAPAELLKDATMNSQPGWYPDPQIQGIQRYWNGLQWSDATRPTPMPVSPVLTQKKSVASSNIKAVVIIGLIVVATLIVAAVVNDALNPRQAEQQQQQQAISTRDDLQSDQTILDGSTYEEITQRDFELILKDVSVQSGRRIILYGSIRQFDSATGPDRFLADVGTSALGVGNFESAHLIGNSATLKPFVKDDRVKMHVVVDGEYSYTSTADFKLTVPQFQVGIIELAE